MTAAGLVAALPGAQAQEPVDVALVLAVDVSRSMSPRELTIQREGYAAALNHPDVVRAIAQGAYGRIAITMFEWAGNGSVREVFDWTLIETAADADQVSALVQDSMPLAQRRTSISGAIKHAMKRLGEAPYDGFRKVIDVSGDGPTNHGGRFMSARRRPKGAASRDSRAEIDCERRAGRGFKIGDLDTYSFRNARSGRDQCVSCLMPSWARGEHGTHRVP